MRIQTIHRNPMGEVLNECSAQGFRISDAEGNSITVTVEGDQINIEGDPFVTGYYDGRLRALRMVPGGISGKKPTGLVVDDGMGGKIDVTTFGDVYSSAKDFDHGTKGDW